MNRILLDTNIYGLIVADPERSSIHQKIHHSDWGVYGFIVVRNELRDVPKKIKQNGRGLRVDLLSLYDDFVKKTYGLDETVISLANNYFGVYRDIGGSISRDKIMNDFLIVACAVFHDLDIVVSEDNHSMRTEYALRAYSIVNNIKRLRQPSFIGYERFKHEIKKSI